MPTPKATRRSLLAGCGALATTTLIVGPNRVRGTEANSAISIGIIGAGDRGSAHIGKIGSLAQQHNVRISAICDVWQVNQQQAVGRVLRAGGDRPRTSTQFGELLSDKSVDAVVIATPDFAHGPILVSALEAGKDVYIEKPMTIDLGEANRALDAARANNRVVQAGTQYRSHGGYTAAARELAAGALGKVHRIHAAANFNQARWARDCANCKEVDVDWAAYLFNRPSRPFDPRLLRRWQLYRACTNGLSGLWMSHYVDAVHLLTGAKYPRSAAALGGNYLWHDGREHTDTFHALLEYPEGFLFDWSMCLGNSAGTGFQVFGTRGMLDIGSNYATPSSLRISAEGGGQRPAAEDRQIVADKLQDHMANWLTCLRTRERPSADIQFGHQHAVATIMAAAAFDSGRRQVYDPDKREIRAG